MVRVIKRGDASLGVRRFFAAFTLVLCGLLFSCSPPIDGGDSPDGPGQGDPVNAAPVVNIKLTVDQNIPADQPFTIVYDASNSPSEVIAFYDTDGVADSGDEFVFPNAGTLTGGDNQAVMFETGAIDANGQRLVPLGTFRFGIRATNGFGITTQYAVKPTGEQVRVRINGVPKPSITVPSVEQVVLSGVVGSIEVQFTCSDPEANTDGREVSWSLFFDTNQVVEDGSAGTIDAGTGNASPGASVQTVFWSTLGIAEDTYNLGLTCTDSAGSIKTVYGSGRVIITDELPVPTVIVTEPSQNLLIFGTDQEITVEFAASDPTNTESAITVFLDTNDSLGFDETEIELASGLSASAISHTVLSSIIPNGEYFVGAYIETGTERRVDYAPGKLTVSGTGDLTISEPSDLQTITPGTDVVIRWNTNVPNGQGLIDLTLFTAQTDGTPLSPVTNPDPFAEAKGLEISPKSTILDTITLGSGFFVVEVKLTPVDENDVPTGGAVTTAHSPLIRVTTLPDIFWVGSIELTEDQRNNPPLGHFDGLIFEGLQFEDNAGTSLLGVGNLDDNAGDEIVIGAQFAKPLFNNPNGIGIGEAYLIYSDGRINRANRRFSLNAVGLDNSDPNAPVADEEIDPNSLPGLVFFGIRFDPSSEDIDGDGKLDGRKADGTILGNGCYTEDADGDGKLDQFDEDENGNGTLEPFEDRDLDSHLDINEDGTLWPDAFCDGTADNLLGPSYFVPQFINGFLDRQISEDRDNDGILDLRGDNTQGLTSLALVPDVDGDDLPEIVFGFKNTDSVKPGRPTDQSEPTNFGKLVQPNQFERGGIVILPTADNDLLAQRSMGGRFNSERIFELDRAGQEFFDVEQNISDVGDCCATHDEGGCTTLSIAGCVCAEMFQCCVDAILFDPFFNGWDTQCVLAVEELDCASCEPPPPDVNAGPGIVGNVPTGRPTNGMDSYPLVADTAAPGQVTDTCAGGQVTMAVVNNTWTAAIARPMLTITVVDIQNNITITQINTLLVVPGTTTSVCVDCNPGDSINIKLGVTSLRDPDFNTQVGLIEEPEDTGLDPSNATVTCGESVIFGLVGPDDPAGADPGFDSFLVCSGVAEDPDNCIVDDLGLVIGCSVVTAVDLNQNLDACNDTIIGPYYGFSYFGQTGVSGSSTTFESPGHPLAYDQTLSNPTVLKQECTALALEGLCNDCCHTLLDADAIRDIDEAPPFDRIASGFLPGATEALGPVGARILGQAVGDEFGQAISRSRGSDNRVFVSAPHRAADGKVGAGAVYQWQMRAYWHRPQIENSNGLNAVDSFGGVPKPHQYIIKDLGFDTPDHVVGNVEGSLKFAITYAGADADDGLGAAIVGIDDFNGDAQADLVMGAPGADGANNLDIDSGAVYIIYRRPPSIEGQAISLADIARNPETDPNRLNGMLINGDSGDRMGQVLAGNCDLNDDETNDVVIGIPDADGGRGEVVIIFGSPDPNADYLPSPTEGYTIQQLVDRGKAVRIQGANLGDAAGFNVTCEGDFDGDDLNDLVISAPFATPQYDSDGDDILDTPGLDLNKDGIDDGLLINPTQAGLVYVILNTPDLSGTLNLNQMGGMLRGFVFAGLRGGDQMGGGVETKRNTRSKGLAYAGDVDADGFDDLLIGSIFADPNGKTNAGEVYLIYGFDQRDAGNFLNED